MTKIPDHLHRDNFPDSDAYHEALAGWVESDDFEPGELAYVGDHSRAVRAAVEAVERADEHLAAMVCAARDAGMSWTLIGIQLGVSRQAARQRFGEPARH